MSCNSSRKNPANSDDDSGLLIANDTVVTIATIQNKPLKGLFIKPDGDGPFPAIVVLHGCGGLWKNDDVLAGEMDKHFRDWISIFKNRGWVGLFIDSYSARDIVEFCNQEPPVDSICSPMFERPKDAYLALDFLQTVRCVSKNSIGLLGFSHGATTALASIVDGAKVSKSEWNVINDGITYKVPAPVMPSMGGRFAAAVAMYPGCGFHSYFGRASDSTDGKYVPYAPTFILHASLDPLFTIGYPQVLLDKAVRNGASTSSGNPIQMIVYEGANHSFDGATSGADGIASESARAQVVLWFERYLAK